MDVLEVEFHQEEHYLARLAVLPCSTLSIGTLVAFLFVMFGERAWSFISIGIAGYRVFN